MTVESALPAGFGSEQELEDFMTTPSPGLVQEMGRIEGDLMILGVGGKMGPTLARLARRALDAAGRKETVYGVSRFSNPKHREDLERFGVKTLVADLIDRRDLERLPDCRNLIFMAGMKFGTSGNQAATWAMNTLVPGYVAERFSQSRVVVFSSGNLYPFTAPGSGGATEETVPEPIGEYAQSVLGRERVFEYFSQTHKMKACLYRLNYAVDLRYGVLVDIGQKILAGQPIDLSMGWVNVIWQGDANRMVLQCLSHCSSPPTVFNVTGPETLSVREIALTLGRHLGHEPKLEGSEGKTALLSRSSKALDAFGPPRVDAETLMGWVAGWLKNNGPTLGKPTHFETRDGQF